MCYNLMKEEILIRLRELKADLIERYFLNCQSVNSGNSSNLILSVAVLKGCKT